MPQSSNAAARTPIDVHVGGRLKTARQAQNLSQSEVASMVGLTFQQIQKYEQGINRLSASVLWTIAVHMDLPVTFFFDGLDERLARKSERQAS